MSLRVGLTGGLATGKSTVAQMFSALGAHVLQADLVAHELMSPGQPVYKEVVRHFGSDLVQQDGTIDRKKLAAIAFGQGRIKELNHIVHPAVIERQEQWMATELANDPKAVAIVEAALIFEAGVHRRFDKLVVVTAARDQKLRRFAERVLGAQVADPAKIEEAESEAQRRIATQIPDSEKVESADFVVDNSGPREKTEEQVRMVWQQLQQLAAEHS